MRGSGGVPRPKPRCPGRGTGRAPDLWSQLRGKIQVYTARSRPRAETAQRVTLPKSRPPQPGSSLRLGPGRSDGSRSYAWGPGAVVTSQRHICGVVSSDFTVLGFPDLGMHGESTLAGDRGDHRKPRRER